jgi:hypothetical protein
VGLLLERLVVAVVGLASCRLCRAPIARRSCIVPPGAV